MSRLLIICCLHVSFWSFSVYRKKGSSKAKQFLFEHTNVFFFFFSFFLFYFFPFGNWEVSKLGPHSYNPSHPNPDVLLMTESISYCCFHIVIIILLLNMLERKHSLMMYLIVKCSTMKNWERKHLREEKSTKYTSSGEMLKWMSMTSSIGADPLRKERPWLGILAGNSLSFANFDYLSFDSNFLGFRLAITMKIHLHFASKPLTSIKEILLDQVRLAFLKSFI